MILQLYDRLLEPKIKEYLNFINFWEWNKTFDTFRMPRPHKNYNFADPLKPWSLAYYAAESLDSL